MNEKKISRHLNPEKRYMTGYIFLLNTILSTPFYRQSYHNLFLLVISPQDTHVVPTVHESLLALEVVNEVCRVGEGPNDAVAPRGVHVRLQLADGRLLRGHLAPNLECFETAHEDIYPSQGVKMITCE